MQQPRPVSATLTSSVHTWLVDPASTIAEAICATISVPFHFLPVKIGPQRRAQSFVRGPFGANNPTRELLKEASKAFGDDKRVAQIIRCGTSRTISLKGKIDEAGAGRLLREMAADCHTVAQELSSRLFSVEAYRRFNVESGTDDIKSDNWSLLGDIPEATLKKRRSRGVSRFLCDTYAVKSGPLQWGSSVCTFMRSRDGVCGHTLTRP